MGKTEDTLCKMKKNMIDEHFIEIKNIVNNPKYICKRCLRVAAKKKFLCKPTKLNSK
jgi:hypothetical protein